MSSVTESVQLHPSPAVGLERGELAQRISELGDWFHNLNLHGVPELILYAVRKGIIQ